MKKKNTNKKLFIAFMILLFLIIEGIDLNRENSSAKLDEKDVKKSKLSYEINNIEKSKIIDNVITYCQYPNYPTGCESVALYILLKYYNVPITMEKIVNNLPKGDLPYDEKGNRYGGNKLLGDELYYKFIKEISKENNGTNLVDFGKEILDKCCAIIVMLGMSKRVKLDTVKLCTGDSIIEVSCKDFADKYERYVSEIEKNII